MRLVTFVESSGRNAIGALASDGRHIVDLTATAVGLSPDVSEWFTEMLSLIRAGSPALERAREFVALGADAVHVALTDVTLLAPLTRPEQIRCFSAFEAHGVRSARAMFRIMASNAADPDKARAALESSDRFEMPRVWYERPLYYKGNRFSVVGPRASINWPAYSNVVDFELELACVLGLEGRDIAQEDASRFIFGYTVCNDLSARDMQSIEMQAPLGPAKGKDFDGGLAMGPCLVTADEFDRSHATMIVRVNGEEWSRGHARDMHHSFEAMIHYVSQCETLYPGEIFLSGCVGGGSGMELGRFAQRGDMIELEIEGIGTLSNGIL